MSDYEFSTERLKRSYTGDNSYPLFRVFTGDNPKPLFRAFHLQCYLMEAFGYFTTKCYRITEEEITEVTPELYELTVDYLLDEIDKWQILKREEQNDAYRHLKNFNGDSYLALPYTEEHYYWANIYYGRVIKLEKFLHDLQNKSDVELRWLRSSLLNYWKYEETMRRLI